MHQWISVAGILCIALSSWANPAPRIKFIQNQGQWCFDYDYTARWGKKIFESENYQNNWRAESQPAGVYYFEARFEDDTRCKGWVQVIK